MVGMESTRTPLFFALMSVFAFSGSGCSESVPTPSHELPKPADSSSSLSITAPSTLTVTGCEQVVIEITVSEADANLSYQVEGYPLLLLEPVSTGLSFQAPSVAYPTTFSIRSLATASNGALAEHRTEILVEAHPPEPGLPPGLVPDCAPFAHGVASGDPTASSVFIWTRLSTQETTSVTWKISEDPTFETVVQQGEVTAKTEHDFTVQVAVESLKPNTTYYYAFWDASGTPSSLGRTRTTPSEDIDSLRFAVASCSSIFSGYFNAYRRIAERADLHGVIHLGDYIYDYVDPDEQVRIPDPYPTSPQNLEQWRGRHAYYLLDPDLRLARAMHPWLVIWDNHDGENTPNNDFDGSIQAFREWVPMRPDDIHPSIAYRTFRYGSLLEIVMLDVLLHRNKDKVPESEEWSILGDDQWDWLESTLLKSQTTWRIIGSQKVLGTVRVDPAFRDGSEYFDLKTWDGFPADRKRLLNLLASLDSLNTVVLSGDSHISLALNLVDNPSNLDPPYDPATSNASVGVELLPTSISRGNFDEQVGDLPELFEYLALETMALNPHHRYLELTRHGYGIIELTPDKVVGEIWYSDILEPTDTETLGVSLRVLNGDPRWISNTAMPSDSR